MALETEAKIRVADHQAIRGRLMQLGARSQGQQLQVDIYFDTAEDRLLMADRALRLRCSGKKNVLTYKGPQKQGRYKQRQEIQTAVEEPQALRDLLECLGFSQNLLFEKRRESWLLNGCRVELDTLPCLGTFVEVEGPSEQDIIQVLGQLQLDKNDSTKTPYPTMLREHLQRADNPKREIRLADSAGSQPESSEC